MRTIRLVAAAYAVGLLLITGTATADVPIGEDGLPVYDIHAYSSVNQRGGGLIENTYKTGDDPPFSTLSPYARTVEVDSDIIHYLENPNTGTVVTVPCSGFTQARANLFSGTLKAQITGSAEQASDPYWGVYFGPGVIARAGFSDLIFFDVGSFDMTNGLPVKVRFRIDGSAEAFAPPVFQGHVDLRATLSQVAGSQSAFLTNFRYLKYWVPDQPPSTDDSGSWTFANGAYETVVFLWGPNPTMRFFVDLETTVFGGDIDYYHTAALSLELPHWSDLYLWLWCAADTP